MIKIVAVGKIKEKYFVAGIKEYLKRLTTYTKVEIIEVKDEAVAQQASLKEIEQAKDLEGTRILSKIKADEQVILLDLHGEMYTSEQFSQLIQEINTYKKGKVVLVIAGSYGYGQAVISRANYRWCLSNCTFPHQLVRLLVVEQVYRAFKIINNERYHK